MPRFKNVPVHVSSPIRLARKIGQARKSKQVKRKGSPLEKAAGSKRARVLRHDSPAQQTERGEAMQEEGIEEGFTPPEGTSSSSSDSSYDAEKSGSEGTESESAEGHNGHEEEESFEQEAEFVRVDTSEAQSPVTRKC
eukprot:TRINITY_DN2779_c0_g2_i1.p1 TRINITY_DN2779_c0_g2~~TRINITY_DN2779_c0_g2_i1.p1  ORF type:complete len:138 (-),score=15.00 TRINITY_DN2779_c0_g2_i1:372-785(-)